LQDLSLRIQLFLGHITGGRHGGGWLSGNLLGSARILNQQHHLGTVFLVGPEDEKHGQQKSCQRGQQKNSPLPKRGFDY
jgi:hypothetical protein